MARIRVLVADGHRIFAEALATALAAEPDVDVAAAGSAQAAERALERAAAENRPFQVLLVDADLTPGGAPPPPGSQPRLPEARRTLAPPQRAPVVHLPAQRKAGYGTPPAGAGPAGAGPAGAGPAARIPAPRTGGSGSTNGSTAATPNPATTPATTPAAPAGDGLSFAARARAAHPTLQVIVLAVDDDPRRVVQALQAGAGAWVAKESSLGRLMAVIKGVMRDETHIPPLLLTGVIRELTAARRDRTESERLVESLTPREKQVLRCMVAGLGRQAVADRLFLSPHTVRTHMQNVLGKLGVHSTLAAVALARRAGVGPAD
ncbi:MULTISPECIES: response regulator transcription factor [Streptacidiphilus]|uniref:LuxR C-terminal-related transcriptional regulator n=1 Tax=Streptacidiphilus cavernicola TaxID=3342716 RepID=A0ABV6ULN7_9ACTN|nr:response regulator transcription factor [Streptacidiphilus jeojiense]